MASRQYDIVVFGATGYTGKLTAEYIAKALPTDVRWAIAGRSASKLDAVAAECKALNPDRIQPAIEVCNLNDTDLDALTKKTSVLIAAVGPYAYHGEYAFKACAENGTHYLDMTGEVPFVARMIKKYENTAKASGSIMIPQIGLDSVPADIVTWTLVNMIKERYSAPTGEVVTSMHDIKAKASGGTLGTIFAFMDAFSLKEINAALAPYAISPIPGPKTKSSVHLLSKIFGVRTVPDLGLLTTSINQSTDAPIVQRSWGMLHYGPKFSFVEYMKTRNYLTGIVFHFALMIGAAFLAIPLFRKVMRNFVYQPGDGPTKEEYKNDYFEYRGIGIPDVEGKKVTAFVKARFQGSLYVFTGVSAAEAAISILRDDHKLPGGIYTPASLGQKFSDRLQAAGFKFEKKFLDG